MRVEAIDHLHLIVPSLEKTKALFSALIGGDFVGPYGGEPWNAWAVWYTLGGMEIFEPIQLGKPVLGGHSSDRKGIFGMAFRVKDLEAAIPEAEALGMRVHSRFGSEDSGFGKMIVQAQFDPSNTFGTILELAQRELPDDPLYSAFPQVIDHIEFHVHDLARAVALFSSLTGWDFPVPTIDDGAHAMSTTNGLGVKITQPLSPDSPVARSLAAQGEGVRTIALTTRDLDTGIAVAQSAGLRLSRTPEIRGSQLQAEFDASDSFGFIIKLIERAAS